MLVLCSWGIFTDSDVNASEDISVSKIDSCGAPEKTPKIKRNDVYSGMPFQAGETANYMVTYGGVYVGNAELEVKKPVKHAGVWNRVFSGVAKTGEWYKYVFVAHDRVMAYSRPWDFGVSKFYISQNESSVLGTPFVMEKWIKYDHDKCEVNEKVKKQEDQPIEQQLKLVRGANDALSAVFNLRTRDYEIGKIERAMVYTSENNWLLEAMPLVVEQVEVPAGKFEAVKLKLQTYLGKDLQQKGDVHMWIATKHPSRPMVLMTGEVKVGSVALKLKEFKKGN